MGIIDKFGILLILLINLLLALNINDPKNFTTTEARYKLGDYEIVITQQKRTYPDRFSTLGHVTPKPRYCTARLEIRSSEKIIDKLDFDDIFPFGWYFGIHLPIEQPSPRHFVLAKNGDYNNRIIVVTDEGKLFNLPGDSYRLFLGRYLVSRCQLALSVPAFTIFDLDENRILLSVDWDHPFNFRPEGTVDNKAPFIKLYIKGAELFTGIEIVDWSTFETIAHTGRFFRIDLEAGKFLDAVFDAKAHHEFVIDDSNLDMSSDCECKNGHRVPNIR